MNETATASILYLDWDPKEPAILPILRRDFRVRVFQTTESGQDDLTAALRPEKDERINIVARSSAIMAAGRLIAAMPDKVETLSVLAPPPARDGVIEPAFVDFLGHVTVPTMLLFGTRDEVSPPQLGRLYRRVLPKARMMFVFDAAEDMANERPEAVAAILREFTLEKERFVVTHKSGRLYP